MTAPACEYFDPSPDNLLNACAANRMVPVQLDPAGPITHLPESDLVVARGGHETEDEATRWVEYRQVADGRIVHRSAHVHLKKATVTGEMFAASLG